MNVPTEVIWSAAGFVAMAICSWVYGLFQKHEKIKEDTIISLEQQVKELVEVVRELRYTVKMLDDKVALVPKLSSDVSKAFGMIKTLKQGEV